MDTIIATIQAELDRLITDNKNRQNSIDINQAVIDANNPQIAALTAELTTLQAPTVQQAINDLTPPAVPADPNNP